MQTNSYLENIQKQFAYYQSLGEKAMAQLSDKQLFWQPHAESNSIAIIVKHLCGNMRSRWTDFLNSDGEKEWRDRDNEFIIENLSRDELIALWSDGWTYLFQAIDPLQVEDLEKIVYIRNMGHTVTEAINRQLAHYAYHVGQIVFIAKMLKGENWLSLSIPKGNSAVYNAEKFAKPRAKSHFTDDFMDRTQNP